MAFNSIHDKFHDKYRVLLLKIANSNWYYYFCTNNSWDHIKRLSYSAKILRFFLIIVLKVILRLFIGGPMEELNLLNWTRKQTERLSTVVKVSFVRDPAGLGG